MADEPIPAILHEGQLRLLASEQHESETLDYKRELDLVGPQRRRAIVELAKDIGAFASTRGGYIAIGFDDRGQLTGSLTPEQVRALDEASLRQMVDRYLPDGIDIRTAVHEIDGHVVGLIYVGRHPDALAIFKGNGTYEENGQPKTVFREGEVFVRRGTQSRRWTQEEARRWIRETQRQATEQAIAEAAAALAPARQQMQDASTVSQAPAEALNWDLDRETLVSAATDQLRRDDDIPLRLLLDSAPARASEILVARDAAQGEELARQQEQTSAALGGLLDRLVALAARGIAIDRREMVDPALEAIFATYNAAFDAHGYERPDLLISPPTIWLAIIERLFALGALAVRKRDWQTVRRLSTAQPAAHNRSYYRAVLRHGHIMAANAGLLQDPETGRIGQSLLRVALEHVARIPELRPDLAADDERLLTSLCQFDLLSNLAIADATGEIHGGIAYPHFRSFASDRTDPAVTTLLDDPDARRTLFTRDDDELADALRRLRVFGAGAAEFGFIPAWDGYEDRRIIEFLDQHPPRDTAG